MPEQKRQAVVAEDEPHFLQPYKMYLEDLGFDVKAVMDKEGLMEAAPHAQLLVVDVCLPNAEKMEGLECVAELIKDSRIKSRVPIIFISGYREDSPMVKKKLSAHSVLKERYRWVWKDDEVEVLGDAIDAEFNRLK